MLPIRITVLFSLIILLSACGYHLRGGGISSTANLKNIYLEGGSTELRDQFNQVLKLSHKKLAKSPQGANIEIRIIEDRMRRRILSLSERGRSNEVEIDYRLEYELNQSGKTLLAGEPLEIRREYFNDQVDIIAKDNEEILIRSEMYEQAVRSLVTRAGAVLEANSK
jgi:LPS-assembly lipoprotein